VDLLGHRRSINGGVSDPLLPLFQQLDAQPSTITPYFRKIEGLILLIQNRRNNFTYCKRGTSKDALLELIYRICSIMYHQKTGEIGGKGEIKRTYFEKKRL
jgi:hypothetical protein